MRLLSVALLPALLPALLLLLAACSGEPPRKVSRGDTPPPFDATRLDGVRVRFPADFAGKPVGEMTAAAFEQQVTELVK